MSQRQVFKHIRFLRILLIALGLEQWSQDKLELPFDDHLT